MLAPRLWYLAPSCSCCRAILPFGTLSAPGAGMMPKLLVGLMILFGIALMFGAAASQPLADIDWGDGKHALMVVVIAAAANRRVPDARLRR